MAPPPARPRGPDAPDHPTPVCRCRVLYLGSAVPHHSKDGLQGIQEPLHELYPSDGVGGANGIDSWLSVWSNGLLLENVDEQRSKITRFFPIEALHYCAAVRQVLVPGPGGVRNPITHFMPLDAPFARVPHPMHPPLFAAILRRTSGLKVLECHVFMCRREAPANALVRSCFHVYADSMAAKNLDGTLYDSIYGHAGKSQQFDESEAKLDVVERDETSEGGATPTPPRSTPTRQPDPRRAPINGKLPTINPLSVDVGDGGTNGHGPSRPEETSRSIYGTARRAMRPRQRIMPAAPPPPPPRPETGTGRRRKQRSSEYTDRIRSVSAAAFSRSPPSPSPERNGNGWDWESSDEGHRSFSRAEVYNQLANGRGSNSPPSRTLPNRRQRPQMTLPPQGYGGPPLQPQRAPLPPTSHHNLATMSLSRNRGPRELRVFTPQQNGYGAVYDSYPMSHQFATLDRPGAGGGWRSVPPREGDRLAPLHHTTGRNNPLKDRLFAYPLQQEQRSRSQGSLLDDDGRPELQEDRSPHQMMANLDLNGADASQPRTGRHVNGATRRA